MTLDCGVATVRHWRRADKESLLRFANDRSVWRNLTHTFPHPYTEADAEAWFALLDSAGEPTHWAVEVEGVAAGGVGVTLHAGIHCKSGEFGYWLGAPYWRRGIMTEVVRAVSRFAMERYGLMRLESPVFAWNPASMRVLEKSGFVREGILRKSAYKDGQVIDTVMYALIA